MNVQIFKCPIPIVWLDTAVIIKMAFWKLGRSLNESDAKKIPDLYKTIYNLVRKKKLICPFGDQKDEIWVGEEVCKDVAIDLSLGIKFRHRLGIENFQTQRIMKVFIEKVNEVELPYTDAFYRDPVEEISRENPFIIHVNTGRLESVEQVKNRIIALQRELESIRVEAQKRKESFEQRLGMEFQGCLNGILELADRFQAKIRNGIMPTVGDFEGEQFLGLPLSWWERYKGQPPGLQGMVLFYRSDAFRTIPVIEIKCKLFSEILTQSVRIESGDSMDIDQLAAVSPYCQMVVTDRKMKNRFNKLKLDEKYNVNVFSLSDYDEIRAYLESIS